MTLVKSGSPEPHPTVDLDETAHQRVRLGILGILSEADRATFRYLREALQVTDGNLSAHMSVLSNAGLIAVDKGYVRNRPRTWVKATAKGRATFRAEMDALRRLIARHDS